jgi:hypothetical protein|tara:strand:- start:1962 stop:2252 length:291 start_codon:yes stop_codon:yes gene_type:complete
MLTETQLAERRATIKVVAEKQKAQQARIAAIKAKAARVVSWVDEVEKPKRKPTQNLTEKYDGQSELHWTDASKYAKEFYGERHYQTTRFDNDWGDY